MEFAGFLGNEQLKENLSAMESRDRLGHFFLISGPEGSGKKTLATILSAAMLCTGEKRPCRSCPQCRKVFGNIHPDVITVDDTEKKTVTVAMVREARQQLFVRPNEGKRKIFLVPRAQELRPEGQNALLKVLEEPPSYGVFLLLTDNPDKLLPTVRSRCVHLGLNPLPRPLLEETLLGEFPQAEPLAIASAAARSGGYLGAAKALLSQGEAPQTAAMAHALAQRDALALTKILVPLEKAKRDDLLELLSQWHALAVDALAARSGAQPQSQSAKILGEAWQPRQLYAAAQSFAQAMDYARGNVSPGAICGNLRWELLRQ